MKNLKIGTTNVILEDLGENQGKIIVSDVSLGYNFSMQWGAMGGNISEFICKINSSYFADKLTGPQRYYVFDAKGTFKNIRKFIREDLEMPWYKEPVFQKHLREVLKNFEEKCEGESDSYFVDCFHSQFIDKLDFGLFKKTSMDSKYLEIHFQNISQPWDFIEKKEGPQIIWLKKLHGKLVRRLKATPKKSSSIQ